MTSYLYDVWGPRKPNKISKPDILQHVHAVGKSFIQNAVKFMICITCYQLILLSPANTPLYLTTRLCLRVHELPILGCCRQWHLLHDWNSPIRTYRVVTRYSHNHRACFGKTQTDWSIDCFSAPGRICSQLIFYQLYLIERPLQQSRTHFSCGLKLSKNYREIDGK